MSTFKQMRDRIAADLRRSNLDTEIGYAINDAISEAAKLRFYFNEMHLTFDTVVGQEYYPDLSLTEIDTMWYAVGGTRYMLSPVNNVTVDEATTGNSLAGQLEWFSRYGGKYRLYPLPSSVVTIHVDGFGKLLPAPLVADADTNAWLDEGELYIRALAKRNVLRDVIRDYGEARILESIAEDYKDQLTADTAERSSGDNSLRSTQF